MAWVYCGMPNPAMRAKSILFLRQACEHWGQLADEWARVGNEAEAKRAEERKRECENELEVLVSTDGPRGASSR